MIRILHIFLLAGALMAFCMGGVSSCTELERPEPDSVSEYYINAKVNGEPVSFVSKTGYSLRQSSQKTHSLVLRANEGYSKLREVPGFELHLNTSSFPPKPGIYQQSSRESDLIRFGFLQNGKVLQAGSSTLIGQNRVIVREVKPVSNGYVLEGIFQGRVQAREGNSIWQFDLLEGKFRVFVN